QDRHLQIDVPLWGALPVQLNSELLCRVARAAFHGRIEGDADHSGDEFDLLAGGEGRSRGDDRRKPQGEREVLQSFGHCDASPFSHCTLWEPAGFEISAGHHYALRRSRLRWST